MSPINQPAGGDAKKEAAFKAAEKLLKIHNSLLKATDAGNETEKKLNERLAKLFN